MLYFNFELIKKIFTPAFTFLSAFLIMCMCYCCQNDIINLYSLIFIKKHGIKRNMAFLTKTEAILAAILDICGTLDVQFVVSSEKDPQMPTASPYKGNKF